MKRYLLLSLLLAAAQLSQACFSGYTFNYYLFHSWTAPRDYFLYESGSDDDHLRYRTDRFWQEYMGDSECSYEHHHDAIWEKARKNGDDELLTYMKWLDVYLGASNLIQNEAWEYPTKEELAESKRNMANLEQAVRNYDGTRLRAQYRLLEMRAHMIRGQHEANVALWEEKNAQLPASVYRDMMENIYAGALFHTGQREKGLDIFARQGDAESVQWALRKYRNMAGIRRIFADNPNSHALYYLIDEFVNNVQEFVDVDGYQEWDEEKGDLVHNTIKENQFREEALSFADVAADVAHSGQVDDPCLWMTARAMVHYELGRQEQAQRDIAEAMKMKGSEDSRRVCRYINMLIMTADPQVDEAKLVSELKWLSNAYRKAKENGADGVYRAQNRILAVGLTRRYHQAGNHLMEAAVWGYYQADEEARFNAVERAKDYGESGWNGDYSTPFFSSLQQLSSSEAAEFYSLLKKPKGGTLDRYILSKVAYNDNFYNDLVGTKMLHDGRFKEAIPYLEQVPLSFLEGLNVSYYLAHRDYHVERWYQKQRSKRDVEGPRQGRLMSNPKLDFCREALQKEHLFSLGASDEVRYATAYALATMFTQASDKGECWYLSAYGWSTLGENEEPAEIEAPENVISEKDEASKHSPLLLRAKEMLELSRKTTNLSLKLKSLYALAWLPIDHWASTKYDWRDGEFVTTFTPLPDSYQYAALQALDSFIAQHPDLSDRHTTRCDVLKQFRNSR